MKNKNDFTKDFFQTAWGEEGYYECFSYGEGIDKVCEVGLNPFFDKNKNALEIGPGGGVFTDRMIGQFKSLTVLDVIKMPTKFNGLSNFTYIELHNHSYDCKGVDDASIDFAFSYNVFCHLSNEALTEYFKGVFRVLKPGGDFVFMIANYENSKKNFLDVADNYKLGDLTPIGHFNQSLETVKIIANKKQWDYKEPTNLLPNHRDILIHIKKK